MKLINQYKKNVPLTPEELEQISEQLIVAGLDDAQKKEWSKKLVEDHGIYRPSDKQLKKRSLRLLQIAAGAALFIAILLCLPRKEKNLSLHALLKEQLQADAFPHISSRKGEAKMDEWREKFVQAYASDDFKGAIALGEQIAQMGPATIDDHFFLGLSYFYDGQMDKAIALFLKIEQLAESNERFKLENRWFLSLAYLQTEASTEAKPLLEYIARNQGWKSQDAAALLHQISKENQ
ncbi:MAG: hypothetical protein R2828_21470 [Saprospiraceae bacterium]